MCQETLLVKALSTSRIRFTRASHQMTVSLRYVMITLGYSMNKEFSAMPKQTDPNAVGVSSGSADQFAKPER
jgi:hypothetical protein